MDPRRQHGRRKLLAKDIGAYVVHLEQTIDALRTELGRSAAITGKLAADAYDRGYQEGRALERRLR